MKYCWCNVSRCMYLNSMNLGSMSPINTHARWHAGQLVLRLCGKHCSSVDEYTWPYIMWPLDFQSQKRIVSAENIWGNMLNSFLQPELILFFNYQFLTTSPYLYLYQSRFLFHWFHKQDFSKDSYSSLNMYYKTLL